jgi:hypothetical protein
MSTQTPAATVTPADVPVPFYKNKKILITAAAVTTVAIVLSVLKFQSNDEDSTETDAIGSSTDASSKK